MAATRTHLLLGEVDPASSPATGAAALYALTEGYGQAVGTDTPLLVETPDIAPLGELGRFRARLVVCPVEYAGACTVRIQPIADYEADLAPTVVALAQPTGRAVHAVQVRMLRACTTLRLRMDVLERTGPVTFTTPMLYFTPLARESGVAMGETP